MTTSGRPQTTYVTRMNNNATYTLSAHTHTRTHAHTHTQTHTHTRTHTHRDTHTHNDAATYASCAAALRSPAVTSSCSASVSWRRPTTASCNLSATALAHMSKSHVNKSFQCVMSMSHVNESCRVMSKSHVCNSTVTCLQLHCHTCQKVTSMSHVNKSCQ